MIFAKNTVKDAARLSLAKWNNKVAEAGFHSFNVIAATFYAHYDDILNLYINRSTNPTAESFNAKIKLFRANLRRVVDKNFFLFRLIKLICLSLAKYLLSHSFFYPQLDSFVIIPSYLSNKSIQLSGAVQNRPIFFICSLFLIHFICVFWQSFEEIS